MAKPTEPGVAPTPPAPTEVAHPESPAAGHVGRCEVCGGPIWGPAGQTSSRAHTYCVGAARRTPVALRAAIPTDQAALGLARMAAARQAAGQPLTEADLDALADSR
ncbi:MAG: hypothetical protein ACRD0J_06745 [Acidimicrobiales bacterium]